MTKAKVNLENLQNSSTIYNYLMGYLLADAGVYNKDLILTSVSDLPIRPIINYLNPQAKIYQCKTILRCNLRDAPFINYLNTTLDIANRKLDTYQLPEQFHNIEFLRGYCDGKASFIYTYSSKKPRLQCQISAQSESLISSISTIIKDIVGCTTATIYTRKNKAKEVVGYYIRLGSHNARKVLDALYKIENLPHGFYNPKHQNILQAEMRLTDEEESVLKRGEVSTTVLAVPCPFENTNNITRA